MANAPALILPIGGRDWQGLETSRHLFLRSVEGKLRDLGLRPGWGFKGNQIPIGGWADECAEDALSRGWLLTWHPGYDVAFGIGKTGRLTPTLIQIGETAKRLKDSFGLEALVIHPDALQFGGPKNPKIGLERYDSRLTAAQVLRGIKNHVPALRELNEICGGILLLENVHTVLFNEKTKDELPTYYAAQLGYLDTVWMAEQSGIGTAFDSEHFWGTYDLVENRWYGLNYPRFLYDWHWTPAQKELAKIAGYYVVRGRVPQRIWGIPELTFEHFLGLMKPKMLHIGSSRSLTSRDQVNTHIDAPCPM